MSDYSENVSIAEFARLWRTLSVIRGELVFNARKLDGRAQIDGQRFAALLGVEVLDWHRFRLGYNRYRGVC